MDSSNSFMLDVKNLNKKFETVQAVKDLSFQIKREEVFGFLGPNGAGKTTTMRILTGFIPASSGTVTINGLSLEDNSLQIRKDLGYLPENNPLYHDMQVEEYLKFVGSLRGLKSSALRTALDSMYHTCGLTKVTKRQIGKLSKGYKQRVGFAQAMIHNPKILILDEPLSGLDPNQIIEIRELIKRLGKEKTVIYCSHILSEVAATCNRILIISEGKIVATGTPEELTEKSGHGNLYILKIKGTPNNGVESKFRAMPGIITVKTQRINDEWMRCHITAEGKRDVGEDIFAFVVQNKWSMSELRREETSLEEIFTKLTRG